MFQKLGLLTTLFAVALFLILIACQLFGSSFQKKEGVSEDTKIEKDFRHSPDKGNEQSRKRKSLKLLIPHHYNELEIKQWKEVIDVFETLHPSIQVKLETEDVKVESGRITSILQSKEDIPDVMLINAGPSRISVLSEAKLIQPLDPLYNKNDWDKKIRPYAYNLISGNEHIYQMPHMIDAITLYYNKEIFEAHHLKVPETPKQLMDALQILENEATVEPITVGARNGYEIGWLFGVMLEALAGTEKVESVLFGEGKWNDPEIVEVAYQLKKWIEHGYISQEAITLTSDDATFRFLNKQAAMYAKGTYVITEHSNEGLEDVVAPLKVPSFVEGEEFDLPGGIGQGWVIPSSVENTDLPETWLNFILSKDYVETVYGFKDYNFILASTVSMEIEPSGDLLKSMSEEVLTGSGYNPSVFNGIETNEAYYQNLQKLAGGLVTPKEAMDAIAQAAEMDKEKGFSISK